LIIASSALLVVAAAIGIGGGAVSIGGSGAGQIAVTVAVALLAGGALLLSAFGSGALGPRAIRIGLAMVGVGAVARLLSAGVAMDDPLIFVFLAAIPVVWLGAVVCLLGLLRAPGRPRMLSLAFLGGLGLAGLAGAIRTAITAPGTSLPVPLDVLTLGLVAAGGVLVVVAIAGIGLLGLRPAPAIRTEAV
jgi:hypothetical protein